jgi:hypothetical protein
MPSTYAMGIIYFTLNSLPPSYALLIKRLNACFIKSIARYKIMHIEEHFVEVLFIVEGILRFEKLIKLINRLIKTFNTLILHIYSKLIMRVFVRTATANTCRVNEHDIYKV